MTEKKQLEEIIIYTTPSCHKCLDVKNQMNAKNMVYTTVMIGINIKIQEFANKFHVQYVPVLEVDGVVYKYYADIKKFVNDFNVESGDNNQKYSQREEANRIMQKRGE
jgi:glutaredoxin